MNRLEYLGKAQEIAARGYAVVSYTSRGFFESGGSIDIMGQASRDDVIDLIDEMGRRPYADTSRVGIAGISYGGGAALLAAAEDRASRPWPRCRASPT